MIDVHLIIKDHMQKRMDEKKQPVYITYTELQREVIAQLREELNKGIQDGSLQYGNTINDRWIATTDI